MSTKTEYNIELSLWARKFVAENRESIDYFLRFGTTIEKSLASKILELAEVSP
jgi:hypothetical protein